MKVIATQLQRGRCLKLVFSFEGIGDESLVECERYNINNLVEVRFRFESKVYHAPNNIIHGISWKNHESVPSTLNNKVYIHIRCEQLQYSEEYISRSQWSSWINMGELTKSSQQKSAVNTSKVTLIVSNVQRITFVNLYEETDFCDFHLKAVDSEARVPVHKACLSLHSEFFKRMLHGVWTENDNDCLEMEGVTFETLQGLKKYIYKGILPDDELQLRSLLLLAKCYMINSLTAECVYKLALTVKPEGLYSLQEFAIDNKILELVQALVEIASDETVQIAHQMKNVMKIDPLVENNS